MGRLTAKNGHRVGRVRLHGLPYPETWPDGQAHIHRRRLEGDEAQRGKRATGPLPTLEQRRGELVALLRWADEQ